MSTGKRKRLTKGQKDYMEKLRDPRWQKIRLQKLDAADWTCQWCGRKDKNLQIEHGYYARGLEPWQYPLESLWVLCDSCHQVTESGKRQMSAMQGRIPPWQHHHLFFYMTELERALAEGQEVEPAPPMTIGKNGEFVPVEKKPKKDAA